MRSREPGGAASAHASLASDAPPAGCFRLSHTQRRLWFIGLLTPQGSAYNVVNAFRASGPLDQEALLAALKRLVGRHAALRTQFVIREGTPFQRVLSEPRVDFRLFDLTALPPDRKTPEVTAQATEFSTRPFDLTSDAPLRAGLFRLSPAEHVIVLLTHHIVCDGWSVNVLLRDLAAFYAAGLAGGEAVLPPLKLGFPEFAEWHHEWLRGSRLERLVSHWRLTLDGIPAEIQLPTSHPRPPGVNLAGVWAAIDLPDSVTLRMREFARAERMTLFQMLLASCFAFLHRQTGETDIVIGTPVAGRMREELDPVIGFFANTLCVRVDCSGDPTFLGLAGRVKTALIAALDYREMPFELLVEELNPVRELGRNPLFQVCASLVDDRLHSPTLSGLECVPFPIEETTSKFDMLVTFHTDGENISAVVKGSASLFEASQIQRMAQRLGVFLAACASAPRTPVSRLRALPSEEERQIVEDWAGEERPYPAGCVHHQFAAVAAAHPGDTALVWNDRKLSYEELNLASSALAANVRGMGVRQGSRVVVSFDRSFEAIVALLAVLKAGGCYVPIDPDDPRERRAKQTADCAPDLILTQPAHIDAWTDLGVPVLPVGDVASLLSRAPEDAVLTDMDAADADSLAYVIYTSGSTGEPKGVEIPHRGIMRLAFNGGYAQFSEQEVFLQLATLSFDASTFEIWGALLHGARCVLFPQRMPEICLLAGVIRRYGVTTLWLTSSLFNTVVDEAPEALKPLRQLLTGGEALSPRHVRKALDLLPKTELINGYGPTENTTFTTCYRIPKDFPPESTSVPIGRPIGNTFVHVLDQQRQPVGVGVQGELYISGDGLARGYVNVPELTAARFVPNPFGPPGSRRYHSGDRVRWLPDGTLEFLGRVDEQVKLRGFRIEPGEVEAALLTHPDVKTASVIKRDDLPGGPALVAYFTSKDSPERVGPDKLTAHLAARLPAYMLPSAYVWLDSLPLNVNGKVDRSRLPVPAAPQIAVEAASSGEEPLMRELTWIWQGLLGRPVGPDDDFFEIGGHSLLAVRLLHAIQTKLNFTLSLTDLFEAPRLRDMARRLNAPSSRPEGGLETIREGSEEPPLVIIGGQPRWLAIVRQLDEGRPVCVCGIDAVEDLRSSPSIEEAAESIAGCIRARFPSGPLCVAGYCAEGMLAYAVACVLEWERGGGVRLALIDASLPPHVAAASGWGRWLLNTRVFIEKVVYHLNRLRRLGAAEAGAYVRERFRGVKYVWTIRDLGERQAQHQSPKDPTDFIDVPAFHPLLAHLSPHWQPETFGGRVLHLRCQDQPITTAREKLFAWRSLAEATEVRYVPGNHFSMFREPNVASVAAELDRFLGGQPFQAGE